MENYGGTFNGDLTHGDFHVKVMGMTVSGSYRVVGQQMELEVTEKPLFVSCRQMENYLSAYLLGNK